MLQNDELIEEKIAENFHAGGWNSPVPIKEAIQGAIQYRRNLNEEDRALYDNAILKGWAPWNASEMVEYASGRVNRSQRIRKHAAAK